MPSRYRRDLPRLKAEIVARVEAGESLRGLARCAEMPCMEALRQWAAGDPAFAQALGKSVV